MDIAQKLALDAQIGSLIDAIVAQRKKVLSLRGTADEKEKARARLQTMEATMEALLRLRNSHSTQAT